MKVFFDIPVYRRTQEEYEAEQKAFIQQQMSEGGEAFEKMCRCDPKQIKFWKNHFWEIYGGCWRFNEIIGFIRLHFFFTQIRGEYWRVTAKKILRTRKKHFAFFDPKVTFEEEIPARSTNAEIFALIQKYLARAQNERHLKRFHIDKSVFENIGRHIDWNGMMKDEQTIQTCQQNKTV